MSLRDDLLAASTEEELADILDAAFLAAGYSPDGQSLRDRLRATSTQLQWIEVLDAACVAAGFTIPGGSIRDQLLECLNMEQIATVLDDVILATAPGADFSADETDGEEPLTVQFTDESTNAPTSWLWEKNDGVGWVPFEGEPTAQNPEEEFAEGTWSVRLTATDAIGSDTETKADYITVEASEPSYVGPLDLVPGAVVAYSLRAMTGGSTDNVVTIENTDTTATQIFPLVDNAVSVANVATFLSGEDGFVRALLDQGSAGADVSNEDSSGSLWVASYQGGKPGISCTLQQWDSTVEAAWPNGEATVFIVGAVDVKLRSATQNLSVNILAEGGSIELADGENVAAGSLDNIGAGIHIFEAAWEFGSRVFLIDGVVQSVADGDFGGAPAGFTETMRIFVENGSVAEVIGYATVLSSGQRTSIRQNIAAYYGITLS